MQIGKLKIDLFYLLMILVIVGMIAGAVFLGFKADKYIEQSGGVKQIIIDVGKDVKDIVREIEKD